MLKFRLCYDNNIDILYNHTGKIFELIPYEIVVQVRKNRIVWIFQSQLLHFSKRIIIRIKWGQFCLELVEQFFGIIDIPLKIPLFIQFFPWFNFYLASGSWKIRESMTLTPFSTILAQGGPFSLVVGLRNCFWVTLDQNLHF